MYIGAVVFELFWGVDVYELYMNRLSPSPRRV